MLSVNLTLKKKKIPYRDPKSPEIKSWTEDREEGAELRGIYLAESTEGNPGSGFPRFQLGRVGGHGVSLGCNSSPAFLGWVALASYFIPQVLYLTRTKIHLMACYDAWMKWPTWPVSLQCCEPAVVNTLSMSMLTLIWTEGSLSRKCGMEVVLWKKWWNRCADLFISYVGPKRVEGSFPTIN